MRLSFIGSLLLAILLTIPVHADVITVTFTSVSQYGSAGDTLTFAGTLHNTVPAVYINGAGINIDEPPFTPATYDLEHYFLVRSEEHTSELQSLRHLVCRLLLEK